ncbi:hypothetical protein [Spongiactinospora sp. TRM90649]|uniref:phage tail assembly protein T n=1 Tax=Spongiactinospora sp. TRM90649 TaxID=3031114 RepID=UPI0023F891E6|nr:hypothetical protein [Spongiactinospora sp. TRM90649]MDF5755825.1 hypothetical protein [Spongiactinospora sp. TRM90649]
MGMPVAEMLRRISGRELAEWAAFEELYGPVGIEARLDRAAALIAERLTNSLTKQRPRPKVEDFLPAWGRTPVEGYDREEDDGQDLP